MLLCSGIGSFVSGKINFALRSFFIFFIPISIIIYIILYNIAKIFFNPSFFVRLFFTVFLISIPSFFMGFAFPSAIEKPKEQNFSSLISFAWAINGFSSVISSIVASIFSMTLGYDTVLFISSVLYLIAGILFVRFSFFRIVSFIIWLTFSFFNLKRIQLRRILKYK